MRKVLFTLLMFSFSEALMAQTAETAINKGNEYYRRTQYDLAERQYKLALQQAPANETAQYNLANALYKQKKYDEATTAFKKLNAGTRDNKMKEAAFYNEGVVHSRAKELDESIEAYKAALRLDPADQQARENLQKALLEKKKQQQEQKQQQQKQPQSSMSKKEAERKLKLLQDKERQLQQRMQNQGEKGAPMPKDW